VPILLGAASFADDPSEGVCFYLDLTDRKKLEQQYLRVQRMESIGTLAGGIAHDLNNILAPIMMAIELLQRPLEDDQAKAILQALEVSAKRGTEIVRQILSFVRGLEGQRIEVRLEDQLKDLENLIKNTFPKNVRLKFSVPTDTWSILGDPTQLHQVLLNLCVNARDAMPSGGNLTIHAENAVLDEHYAAMNVQAKPGRYVNIIVTDSGTGMPPAVINRIFEPFFTTKDLTKGTGLRLSTVMSIVKSHEGVINVYSELGNGTRFNVYLPAMDASDEKSKAPSREDELPRGNGETVLVADDEASILIITVQTLQAFGYKVLTATDGAEAVAVYAEHKREISVVLTDMTMPIMDGPATIRALIKINPAIKIIAVTGLNVHGNANQLSEAKVKTFLTKPFTAKTLLTTMRAVLDGT
jgi:nitrogen-specific signal transduction histidine kinase/CheY-like chemotaxis protein